jgi:hypothetical protein
MSVYTGLQYNDTSSTTLAGLKQDVYFLTKTNSQAILDGDLLRILNKYYAQLQEAVKAVNENFYLAVATSNLVIGDGTYTYPDGTGTAPAYEKVKSIWAAFNPATPATPLTNEFERVNIIDNNQVEDPSYEFTHPTAVDMGTYFILHPLVTDATIYPVTGGVKIYYIATQDKLVNDTDVPKIFPSFHDAISQGASIDVAERLGNLQLKKDSIALFAKRLADIKAYASGRIADEIGLVEGQESAGGWEYDFGQTNMS